MHTHLLLPFCLLADAAYAQSLCGASCKLACEQTEAAANLRSLGHGKVTTKVVYSPLLQLEACSLDLHVMAGTVEAFVDTQHETPSQKKIGEWPVMSSVSVPQLTVKKAGRYTGPRCARKAYNKCADPMTVDSSAGSSAWGARVSVSCQKNPTRERRDPSDPLACQQISYRLRCRQKGETKIACFAADPSPDGGFLKPTPGGPNSGTGTNGARGGVSNGSSFFGLDMTTILIIALSVLGLCCIVGVYVATQSKKGEEAEGGDGQRGGGDEAYYVDGGEDEDWNEDEEGEEEGEEEYDDEEEYEF